MTEVQLSQFQDDLSIAWSGLSFRRWKPGAIVSFLLDTLLDKLDDFDVKELPIEVRQKIHDTIQDVYDKVIRSIDLPVISGALEVMVKDFAWDMLCKFLCQYLDLDMHA